MGLLRRPALRAWSVERLRGLRPPGQKVELRLIGR